MAMQIPIVYFSSSNNTKYTGELIGKGLASAGLEAVMIPVEQAAWHREMLEKAPVIGLGSPVYGGLSEPIANWASGFDFTGKRVFLFFTATYVFLDVAGEAARLVERNGGRVIGAFKLRFIGPADGLYLMGGMVERFPLKREDLIAAYAFGQKIGTAIKSNGQFAFRRGDVLLKSLQYIIKSIKPAGLSLLKNLAYEFSPALCIACKKCENACPMEAILITDGPDKRKWDRKKCVVCLRCLKVCPTGALHMKFSRSMEYYRGPWQLKGYVKPDDLAPTTSGLDRSAVATSGSE
jgi:ferredoxin/flavodoxin